MRRVLLAVDRPAGASVRLNDGLRHVRPSITSSPPPTHGTSTRDPQASPVFADLGGLPPLLLQVGSTELLLDDARRVHHKILKAGGSSRLEIFDDVFHCWQMLDGLVPEARAALRQAADFIREHAPAAEVATGA